MAAGTTHDSLEGHRGGSRRRRGRGRRALAEINVTPMVDVMLVLLIIFMVTAPLLTLGVDVDLPRDALVLCNLLLMATTLTGATLVFGAAVIAHG